VDLATGHDDDSTIRLVGCQRRVDIGAPAG
jgi:hypothetical protein